jgi:hypothetical protein
MRLLKTVLFICLTSSYGRSYRATSRVRGLEAPIARRRRLVTDTSEGMGKGKPGDDKTTGKVNEHSDKTEMLPIPNDKSSIDEAVAKDTEMVPTSPQHGKSISVSQAEEESSVDELVKKDKRPRKKRSESKGKFDKKQRMASKSMFKQAGKTRSYLTWKLLRRSHPG